MAGIRQVLIALTQRTDAMSTFKDLGKLAMTALRSRQTLPTMLDGMDSAADFHKAETSTWIPASAIAEGKSGPFDACDLLCYLEIAKRAGVKIVPARVIATLTEAEADAASGSINLDDPRSKRILTRLASQLPKVERAADIEQPALDTETIRDKLMDAMDDIPEGWMVRNVRAGGSNLKALAGFGLAGDEVPEVRFHSQLEVGPGWVRVGNRRMIDMSDRRTIQAIAEGPWETTSFVARPWVKASRWRVGEDPHRHGTAFAGKGAWPCEWRAFIADGKVVGVSNYYGWIGKADPLEASIALLVREKAQAMADVMVSRGLFPRLMDTEFYRRNEKGAEKLGEFGRDMVACTIDFIETENGLLMLEGGPGHTPFGGGHCCAFAGTRGAPTIGNAMDVTGVAFQLLPGVVLADMASWAAGETANREGCILTWDDVEQLANTVESDGPMS